MKTSGLKLILIIALWMGMAVPARALTLSDIPLFLQNSLPPNVMLDLSIETPMGGAGYPDGTNTISGCGGRVSISGTEYGVCYFPTYEYLGIFDPNKCYTYNSGAGYFEPFGATGTNHTCSGQWSGNFLNWATMTAIDEFRWVMTGGDRYTDTATTTVLQRATAQNNQSWFPLKRLRTSSPVSNVAPNTVTARTESDIIIRNHDQGRQMRITNSSGGSAVNYQVRVKVCVTGMLEKNCTQYGSNYKPEGQIQKNASRMRFGLFSYLKDDSQSRNGGVLRARMKYTGPLDGAGAVNPLTEWNASTGVFNTNPDSADASASGVSNSGVINYINKFGANGYKSYDPIGELYYEILRYFKNVGPTPEYSSGLTTAMKDGFPVITTWDDPVQAWCQKNSILAINDANPWLDKKLPGTAFMTATLANGTALSGSDYGQPSNPDTSINVRTLTNTVGSLQGINGTSQCIGGDTNSYNTSATNKTVTNLGEVLGTCPYTPKQNSYYIAGLAYYAHTNDIRPLLTKPAVSAGEPPNITNITSYFIDTQEYQSSPLLGQMNPLWLAAKYGGFIETNKPADTGWNNPNISATGTNNTEWDANGDGSPDNYILASNADKLVNGIQSMLDTIFKSSGSAAGVATNTTAVSSGTKVFQAKFNSGDWSGQILAVPYTTGGFGTTTWDAGALLASPTASTRVVTTYKPSTGTGIPFQWPSNPSSPGANEIDTAQATALQKDAGGNNDGYGQKRLDYIRGSSADESTGCTPSPCAAFRKRSTSKLGDIVNSSPVYVGPPAANLSDSGYAAFAAANVSRTPILYVGANDGMLHGFDAATGAEKFAYIPSSVVGKLSNLTSLTYNQGTNHRFYVDGSPATADVYGNFPGCSSSPCWRTVLVGGLGAGGQGIFALDITDPSALSEGNANNISLWEFTDNDDADLGYTFGKPVIGKVCTHWDTTNNVCGTTRWAAIFGNGLNNTADASTNITDTNISTTGTASIYIVFLDAQPNVSTGKLNTSDWIKIDTKAGPLSLPNGISEVAAIDVDNLNGIDYLYAGDLRGNLWKFDIQGSTAKCTGGSNLCTGNWKVAHGTVAIPEPLFITSDKEYTTNPDTGCVSGSCTRQPIISQKPALGTHINGGVVVLFGTGKYIESSDISDSSKQTFYAIWDHPNGNQVHRNSTEMLNYAVTVPTPPGSCPSTPSTATSRTTDTVPAGTPMVWYNGTTGYYGWLLDLPECGERVPARANRVGNGVVFNTFIPSTQTCDFGGDGWLMVLHAMTGAQYLVPIYDSDGDGSPDVTTAGVRTGAVLGGFSLLTTGSGTTGTAATTDQLGADQGNGGVWTGGTSTGSGNQGFCGVGSTTKGNLVGSCFTLPGPTTPPTPTAGGRVSWRELIAE